MMSTGILIAALRGALGDRGFFASPYWFFLGIPLLAVLIWNFFIRKRTGVIYSDVSVLKYATPTFSLILRKTFSLVPFAILTLLIFALARPQSGREDHRVQVEGISIMMCIDKSGSMQATDFRLDNQFINRLDAVKKTFRDFVLGTGNLPGRSNDKIGLIAFGGFVDSLCPLTLDHTNLIAMLESIQLAQPIQDGLGQHLAVSFVTEERLTAIGDALVEAVDRLKDVPSKSKVIILLSDGEQTAGIASPLEGAQAAKAFGIKIYTIGIGTSGMATFIEKDRFGQEMISHQPVFIDQKTLLTIAQETGGQFFNAQDTETLEKVYAQIDQLEKSTQEGRIYTKHNDHYRIFLWPAFVLLVLYTVLGTTRFRTIPCS